jgi:hypothetical protein
MRLLISEGLYKEPILLERVESKVGVLIAAITGLLLDSKCFVTM